jgi:hypothetical protein
LTIVFFWASIRIYDYFCEKQDVIRMTSRLPFGHILRIFSSQSIAVLGCGAWALQPFMFLKSIRPPHGGTRNLKEE